ncbi:MAG TPA: hypothetical protein P5268_07985 [Candidatus Marinimicrobia bacterium]|nr:hypothetical protein [Candidatus Neomarinimicrobiota bacterium]HRS52768.1 hypothetical protein [Candidatus Neomarinimicrobiota bacterium]HRU92953.1 hypothetical protein [Candidatus Neomarinimicrobiota bacterium]
MSVRKRNILFRQLRFNINSHNIPELRIFYPIENGRSEVIEAFNQLSNDDKKNIKRLIIRMATNGQQYRSPHIKWNLTGRNFTYGEISHHPHRFFFFRYRDSLVFFGYISKKVNKLSNSIYQSFQYKKDYYEQDFSKVIDGI